MTPEAKPVRRIQQNLVAAAERRLLNWLCARLPAWVTPDQLTILGLVGAVLVCVGYTGNLVERGWLWLSVAGYVVNWFGDSLDGSLARFRKIERPRFGYFVDHSADGIGSLLIVGGIGLSPYVRLDVALVALAGYYLMSIHAFLAAKVIGELKLSYVSAGPTELRLVLIAMTMLMYFFGADWRVREGLTPFDLFVGTSGVLLIFLFVYQTVVTARRIAAQGE